MGRLGQSEPPFPKSMQLGAFGSYVRGDFIPMARNAPKIAAHKAPIKKRPGPLIDGRLARKSKRDMRHPAAKRIFERLA